ncbi:MAG: hypothetical protein AB8B66_00725 [Rickettsiaceae bacterium]
MDICVKPYWGVDRTGADGYFVSIVGVNEQIIKIYGATGERRHGESAAYTRFKADLIPRGLFRRGS